MRQSYLMGGGKVFIRERWPLENRLKIADELSNTFKVLQLPIALSWMERAKFPLTFELPEDTPTHHKTVAAHVVAFTQCAMTIELWMRQNTANEVCLLIAEDNQNARKLIKETQSHHQDKSIIQTLTEKEKQFFPYTKIKEDPLFQSKKRSSPLQLADYCAYVFKRFLMKDSRYDRFLDPMRGQFVVVDDSSAGQSP